MSDGDRTSDDSVTSTAYASTMYMYRVREYSNHDLWIPPTQAIYGVLVWVSLQHPIMLFSPVIARFGLAESSDAAQSTAWQHQQNERTRERKLLSDRRLTDYQASS